MSKIRKAVIPAAGMGTRFLPATKAQPKEMLPILDTPAIEFIIKEAMDSGIEDILIVTGRNKKAIEDHFDRSVELEILLEQKGKHDLLQMVRSISNIPIHYIRQKEALGLGHAIYTARHFVGDEPFAVLLGDDVVEAQKPCLQQLIEIYDAFGGSILGVQRVADSEVDKYGIVKPAGTPVKENVWQVASLVEKPTLAEAPSNLAILGRYIIQPEIFTFLEKAQPGKNGEIQLTDSLVKLAQVQKVFAYNFYGKRYDIGDKLGFLEATVETALKSDELKEDFLRYLRELLDNQPQA